MALADLNDLAAVRTAAREYDDLGRDRFLALYRFGASTRYYAALDGRLYDAKGLVGVAHGAQHPEQGPLDHDAFSGGEAGANAALRRLGVAVVDSRPGDIDGERRWRLALWDHLRNEAGEGGLLPPRLLHEFGAYGGAQGVWVDTARTGKLHPGGLAVGVLHTGVHYPDDLDESGIMYHYPRTRRPPSRDRAEVDALKASGDHKLPVFVVTRPTPSSKWRQVRLGWVEGWDDRSEIFLITFVDTAPQHIVTDDHSDDVPFVAFGNRSRRSQGSRRIRPGQQKFKLLVFQRYGALCPLSRVTVPQMLDAAHIIPDAEGGTDDPRNGLPLNAALHRAFDADLFAIHPETYEVRTLPTGPSLSDLGIAVPTLAGLTKLPASEALRWRYATWCKRRLRQQ